LVILLLIVIAAAGGKVKENVGPGAAAVCDSTRMQPPGRATISLQIVSPMPMVGHPEGCHCAWQPAVVG